MADFNTDLPDIRYDEAKPGSRDFAIIEWCEAKLQEGRGFVESSIGYDQIERSQDAIFAYERNTGAVSYAPVPKPLSRTRANLVAKTAEDLTALLTDTRVFWNYSTHNPTYEAQAQIANKQAAEWYTNRGIDLRIADCIRYYTIAGTAFAHLYYSRRIDDMMLEAEDPRNVFPVHPASYHTVQDALGVIVRRARTVDWVKAEYGKDVRADAGGTSVFGWIKRTMRRVSRVTGPLSKPVKDDDPISVAPTVYINTMYLNDPRTNKREETVRMGEWEQDETGKWVAQNRWSYEVPPGEPLYPFKRMIVWCSSAVLYDGPSPYWHGMFPLIKLTLNPWPNSWLGKGPLWDVLPLVESLNSLLRVIDDHAAQVAQPGVIADRNVSKAELDKFNSRLPGAKIRTNMASGKGIIVQNPPPLDQSLWEHVKWIQDMVQQLSGTADVSQMAQLAQIPSDDTIDTIMKAMTPGVRLRSRILEGFMKELAEMYLYSMAEFDTLPKRIAKFGPNAVTKEDFDYDPATFIPDDVPDGTPGDVASTIDALGADNPRPLYKRARAMFESFVFKFQPGSLLNSAAQQEKMEDLMLSKMGYVSWFTVMERLGRMNLVPATVEVPSDELGRLQLQMQMGIGMVANAQGRKATDQAPPKLSGNGQGDVTLQTS